MNGDRNVTFSLAHLAPVELNRMSVSRRKEHAEEDCLSTTIYSFITRFYSVIMDNENSTRRRSLTEPLAGDLQLLQSQFSFRIPYAYAWATCSPVENVQG